MAEDNGTCIYERHVNGRRDLFNRWFYLEPGGERRRDHEKNSVSGHGRFYISYYS